MSRLQRKLTYSDFLSFPDDGKLHELVNGVHYVTPSPNLRHQELVGRLFVSIANFLATRRHLGRAFVSPLDVVMSNHDVVAPDLLFIADNQLPIITDANIQGAPALVIEVLSPGTKRRDQGIKRRLFDERGVREYWMVDPKSCRVSVCRRAGDGAFPLVDTPTLAWDGVLTTPLLPGWSLPLRELFEELR